MKTIATAVLLLAAFALAACKDVPGADGRYAVHDGGNRHGSP
jgi:predicted small secreted protein